MEDRESSQRSEDRAVGEPVKRRIQEGTEARSAGRHTRQRSVDRIAEHHDRQGDAPLPDPPPRDTDDRDGHGRDCPSHRHHVRGHTHAREHASQGREHGLGDRSSVVAEHQPSFGQAAASRARASSSSSGTAFVRAMMGRKFASPAHRGTTCW